MATADDAPDLVDRLQQAWRAQRPDVDVSSIGILSRVTRIARYLSRARGDALAALGTDAPTLDVLATLRRSGPPFRLSAGELRQSALITAGAITQRVDRLVAAGLVRRVTGGPDRRVVFVCLTAAGRRLADRTLVGLMEREAQYLDPLNATERRQLERLLRRWLLWLERHHPI